MRRVRGSIGAVILGLAWAGAAEHTLAEDAASPKKGPALAPAAATQGPRQPVWQIVISPNFVPATIAEFYEEADGSLTVIHRPAAGATVPAQEQLAPPPAPAKPAEPATSAQDGNGPARFAVSALLDETQGTAPTPENKAAPAAPAPSAPATAESPTTEPAPDAATPAEAAPLESLPAIIPAAAHGAAWGPGHRPSYAEVYFSIPFLRSEYDANPSYRHEATMELLFGQLRPTVIHKYVPAPIVNRYDYITPYSYTLNGRGVSYNFFYPRPSVYRRY